MTTKGIKVNRLALTWWIYLTLVPGMTCVPFAYAGFSSKDRKLVYWSFIYLLQYILIDYSVEIVTIMWIGGIIHAFSIKNKYIDRRLELKANELKAFSNVESSKEASINKKETSITKKEIVKIKIEEELKEEIETKTNSKNWEDIKDNNVIKEDRVVEGNKAVMLDLGEESNQLIDINNCSEEELEKLPFINSIIAKKAIQQRETIGNFTSVEEFGISIGLKPHIIEKIRPLVIVREINIIEDKKEKHRVIDL